MAFERHQLVVFMEDRLGLDAAGVTDDTPLFSSAVLDSFSLVDLVSFVEKQIGAKIKAMDVNLDNFDTIERIIAYASRRTAAEA